MKEKDYKENLNLPKTNFSMRANLTSLEPRILRFWEEVDIYKKLRQKNKGKPKFVLHDGPPYANGLIHIGHVLNKVLKDIVIKFKFMQGYDCPFICGWDCHGLPVEHQLFKELKLTKHDVDIIDFRKKAAQFALKFVELQKKDFIRLGCFSDWSHPYLTLDKEYEYWVIKLLEELVKRGYLHRKMKPVNWCYKCETALAEAEVEYQEKESHSIYLLFKVKQPIPLFPSYKEVYFLVWTTTPWTLISNVGVAVHPRFSYVLAKLEDKFVILAKDLIPSLEETLKVSLKVLKEFEGKELEYVKLEHPFLDRESLVVLGDFVSREEGSGCVHIAPGHGEEDFSLVDTYNLRIIMPVNEKGIFTEEAEEFAGKNIEEASLEVIEKLREKKYLLLHHKIVHSYPHCWRCKNPIIFRATFQWFLKIDHSNLRQGVLKEIERVKWIPSSGLERMKAMVEIRPDWCLSRQRLWGVPIPAIKCQNCREVILDEKVIELTSQVFRDKGSDSWFTLEVENFLPPNFSCPKCKSKEFVKEEDILDVWFESGASFLAVLKTNPDLSFPADMYLEGSDQHRGWFQVSLIPSQAIVESAPFKAVLTHGFVVDGEGRKMSKSLGNVISPQEIINRYGAEILRLWVASSDYSEDVRISSKILNQLIDFYRKVRNTIRFLLGNLYDFYPSRDKLSLSQLEEVDRFMLSFTSSVFEEVLAYYESFAFYKVCQKVYNFCNISLSSFYLDILKDRLYTYSPNSRERKSAQNVLYYILRVLIKMIAPILSFTAEEAHQVFLNQENRQISIYLHNFNEDIFPHYRDKELEKKWTKILSLRDTVLKKIEKQRESQIIGSSLEAEVILSFPEKQYSFYKDLDNTLREVFIVSKVEIVKGEEKIEVRRAKGKKCLRCWNYREDVGIDDSYPDICGKCLNALKEGRV
ncbi:MAG: isoleucine--tRNA ligase [Candidatus Omnitrophica bacterium]|nr:isoleucine--tRNA ligase [Candidatus Omnitrophota bacterium]